MGDCLVVTYIIRTFDLSMVKSETGQRNKFFFKRVDSDLPYSLVWGKYIRRLESTCFSPLRVVVRGVTPQTNTQR